MDCKVTGAIAESVGDEMCELFVIDVECNPMAKREVRERVRECKCLACEPGKAVKRGLCITCYNAMKYTGSKMSRKERTSYEAGLIRKGLLLAAYDSTYKVAKNIFQKFAK